MKLLRPIATVSSLTVLSRITGFVRDILIAFVMGAGVMADAFYVAFQLPNFFRRLFAEGAFNAAFIPTFSALYASNGKEEATICAEQVLAVLATVLALLVLFFEIFLPWIMYIVAPGFSETPYRFDLTINLTRITFPYIMFISLAALFSGILNSLHKFAVAAAAPVILNMSMIAAMLFFPHVFPTPAHALAVAIFVAGIGQLYWLHKATQGSGIKLKLRMPRLTEPVRRLMRLMLPSALAAGVIQLNMFIGIIFLSFLPAGSISFFFFADRVNQLPLSLVGVAVSTALLPALSKHVILKQIEEAKNTLNRALEFSYLLILPAAVALFLFSKPIIASLFGRGEFRGAEIDATANVLSAFSLGLPAYVLVKVVSTSFFARHDTKTPLHGAVAAVVANILLNCILVVPFSYVGIATSTAIASWVNAGWLLIQLRKQDAQWADSQLKQNLIKMVGCSLLLGVGLFFAEKIIIPIFQESDIMRGLILVSVITVAIVVYFVCLFIIGVLNLKDIKKNLRRQSYREVHNEQTS